MAVYRTRVPLVDNLFDTYIRDTTTKLLAGSPTGAVRLGLSTQQSDDWVAFRDAWVIIYPKYTDKDIRTKTITTEKNKLKKDFKTFAVKPLMRIESSDNLTEGDRITFNLPPEEIAGGERGAITDIPFGRLKGVGGGTVEVRARRDEDATRSSMHPLADAIEFKYLIVGEMLPNPPSGDDQPTPDNCPHSVLSKKAIWRIHLGNVVPGKRILGFLRWVNISNPEKNSDWSTYINTIVS